MYRLFAFSDFARHVLQPRVGQCYASSALDWSRRSWQGRGCFLPHQLKVKRHFFKQGGWIDRLFGYVAADFQANAETVQMPAAIRKPTKVSQARLPDDGCPFVNSPFARWAG
jgi:hypothetical protein